MQLRLSLLALKIKISRLLNFGFSIFLLFFCQNLVSQFSYDWLGISLGPAVWIIAIVIIGLSIAVNSSPAQTMSDDNDKFLDLNEFQREIEKSPDIADNIKMRRFFASLREVFKNASGLSHTQPQIFVTKPALRPDSTDEEKLAATYKIYHAGLGKGKVINSSFEAIMDDEITQDQMSYIIAHELGHSQANATSHLVLATAIFSSTKFFLNFFTIVAITTGIASGSWTLLWTISILYFLNNFLTNLTMRLEEYYADSFAWSLGFGKGGEEFFRSIETKGIGVFPSFLEIFVNHPNHSNRRKHLISLKNNDEGFIPDTIEKFLYSVLIFGIGTFVIFTTSTISTNYVLFATLVYLGTIGGLVTLGNSRIQPKTTKHYLSRIFSFIVSLATLYIGQGVFFTLSPLFFWVALGAITFVFLESVINHSSEFINLLSGYLDTLIFFLQLWVLFQIMGINPYLPRLP